MTELQRKHSKGETVSILLGAAFLMATSAIGPGFITQTTVFTERLKAAFAFAIVVSVLVDIVVQLNVWRILAVSGLRGQDVANRVLPGLGYFLAFAVALGGLAFNIGNVGGAALGFNVMLGMDQNTGAIVSAVVAIAIFLWRDLGRAMDRFTQVLGLVMLAMIAYVVVRTSPPAAESVREIVKPSVIDWTTILTLVGGTVGGYITFSGAHRIIDAGIVGTENLGRINRGSLNGILITGIIRFLLFMAVLGVVVTGVKLDPSNPAADAFRIAAGEVGYRIFGVILWSRDAARPGGLPQRNDPAALVGLHASGRAPQGHHGPVPPSRLAHRPGVGYGRLHGLDGLGRSAGARQAVRPMSRVF